MPRRGVRVRPGAAWRCGRRGRGRGGGCGIRGPARVGRWRGRRVHGRGGGRWRRKSLPVAQGGGAPGHAATSRPVAAQSLGPRRVRRAEGGRGAIRLHVAGDGGPWQMTRGCPRYPHPAGERAARDGGKPQPRS